MSDEVPGSGGYRFIADHTLHQPLHWVRVEGGDLPMPIEIRVDRAQDGRFVFSGIKIGTEGMWGYEEITSQTLREIRLAEILAAYYEVFRPDYVFEMESGLAKVSHPNRPPRGPDNQALGYFARTYLTELARQPHRAMTAAARKHNISRATANRWAAVCREIGLLPGASPGGEPSP